MVKIELIGTEDGSVTFRVFNGFKQWSELKTWKPTTSEVLSISKEIYEKHVTTLAAEAMKEKEDDWNAHDIYFLCDALFFCEFEQAVAYADAGRVI